MSSDLLRGLSLYLIGMMGAGKSTVGRILSDRLGYQFFDTDTVVEQVAQQPITEIFARDGEAAFRELETTVLAELSSYTKLVIATGGGIVLQPMNWSYLRHGVIVWLDVSVDQLYDRLKEDTTRPLLRDTDPVAKLRSILEQRQALYRQADLTITIQPGEPPEQIATNILDALPTVIKPESPTMPSDEEWRN